MDIEVEAIDPWRERQGNGAQPPGAADHCTKDGAIELARRLDDFWASRGEKKLHEAYPAEHLANGKVVWGVRATRIVVEMPKSEACLGPVDPAPHPVFIPTIPPDVADLVRKVVKERHPGIWAEEILYAAPRVRLDAAVTAARSDCFCEIRKVFGWGGTRIAKIFGCNESTALYATNGAFREKRKRQMNRKNADKRRAHAQA